MAGLPGTGLGGIFYVLLVLFITLREMMFYISRRSSQRRRTRILRMLAMVFAMGGVFVLEGYVIMAAIGFANEAIASSNMHEPSLLKLPEAIVPQLAWTGFILLALVLGAVQIVKRLVLRQN